ncbi:MAG: hypothetical protein ACPLRA_05290 [Candidatus Saccharicenans sp.]
MKKNSVVVLAVLSTYLFILISVQAGLAGRKNLEIIFQEKKISELNPNGLTISFLSQVTNLSERNFALISYQYQVLVSGREYLRQQLSLDQPLEIPAEKSVTINFPVKINYQYLSPGLNEGQKQANCLVSGEFYFQDEKKKVEKIPFSFLMDFPIFKMPEIIFLPLSVKTLSLGGADFSFLFQVKNINPYDLLIQKLSLELKMENRLIYSGQIPGDKTLAPGQTKTFSLPLVLDFFEQGRELRDSLEKETIFFALKAWFLADSAWGELNFSVEKQDLIRKEFLR